MVGEWWSKLADIQMVHIPYKGGGQASTDLVGNQLPVAVLGLAPMLAQHRNGKVRVLAVTSPQRNPALRGAAFDKFLKDSVTQWEKLIPSLNIKLAE